MAVPLIKWRVFFYNLIIGGIFMNFLEKDLEEIIYCADKDVLCQKGLNLTGFLLRQKRIGNYGIADIIEVKRPYYHSQFKEHCKGEIVVYELKKDKISVSSFFQAMQYIKGIQRYLDKRQTPISDHYNYRIVLIGKTIDITSSLVYLPEFMTPDVIEDFIGSDAKLSLNLYTYSFDINGLYFDEQRGYKLTNEGL